MSRHQFIVELNYMAISRVIHLEGLLFKKPFDLNIIQRGGQRKTAEFKALDWLWRSNKIDPL